MPNSTINATVNGLNSTAGNVATLDLQVGNSTVASITSTGVAVTGTVSATGVSSFPAGSNTAPSITFTGDTNTGIYSPAADTIAFTEGGVEAMRINSSGNVGIGTSSPSGKFEIFDATSANVFIQGNSTTNLIPARYSTDASSSGIAFRKYRGTLASPTAVASGDNLGTITFQGYGGTNNRSLSQIIGTVDTYTSDTNISSYLTFATSASGAATPTERMRIDSSGNVGIGLTPTASVGALQVSGGAFASSTLYVGQAGSTAFSGGIQNLSNTSRSISIESDPTNAGANSLMYFNVDGTTRMAIDSSGNVGIGTSSPAVKLNAVGSIAASDSTTPAKRLQLDMGASSGTINCANYGTGMLDLNVQGQNVIFNTGLIGVAERMRIDSSGNVGIGTSSPGNNRLHVRGTTSEPLIRAISVSPTGNGIYGQYNAKYDGTASDWYFGQASGGEFGFWNNTGSVSERMRITSGGDLQFNSGYGSVATAYGCRVWVNFNGTGTVAIRASGNVTSITDNGTGDYTVNFTTAMPDANYGIAFSGDVNTGVSTNDVRAVNFGASAAGSLRIYTGNNYTSPVGEDWALICLSIFR